MSSLALLQSLDLVSMMVFDVFPFRRFVFIYLATISWSLIAKAHPSNSEDIFISCPRF